MDQPPPPHTPPPPGPQPVARSGCLNGPAIVVFGLLALGVVFVVWASSQPSLPDAAEAARAEGCDDVTESARRVVVRAPIGGGPCARAAGAAAGTLGFDRDDVAAVFAGGRATKDGVVMTGEADGLVIVVAFTDR